MDNRKLTAKILVEEFGWNFFSRRTSKDPAYVRVNTQHKHESELLFDVDNKIFFEKKDPSKRFKYPYCNEYLNNEFYLDGVLTDITVEDYINKYIL
jgi:hypothetical protein